MSRDAGSMIPRPTGVFNPDSLLNKSSRQTLTNAFLLIHESPLTDALFLLVSKSDEVTTT